MKRCVRHLGFVVVCALVATLLGSATVAGAAKEKLDKAATLRFASSLAPTTWDPHTNKNAGAWQIYSTLVYDRLIALEDYTGSLKVVPQLATTWSYSSDRLSLELSLRKDVKFQDGTPFNAAAVKANLDRAKTLVGSTSASLLTSIASVEVVNDATVRLRLSKVDSGLLFTLANVPGDMISPAAFSSNLERTPVGSGPYKLTNSTSTEADFDRWDGYWNKDRGLAAHVVVQGIPDITARMNLFKSGQLDIANISPSQYADADAMVKSKQASFTIGCSYPSYMLLINTAHKPFDNLDVRKAINLAIDRKTISTSLLPFNKPIQQLFPPGFEGHVPALDKNIPFNVNEAKSMMTKAGASNVSMNIILPATDPYPDLSTVIQRQLGAIGINVTLQQVPPAISYSEWLKGTADGLVGAFAGSVDSAQQLNNYINTYNFGGAAALPAGLTDKATSAAALPVGSKQRIAAYQEIDKMLVASPVHAPLLQFCTGLISKTNVTNMNRAMPTGNISWTDLAIPGVTKAAK